MKFASSAVRTLVFVSVIGLACTHPAEFGNAPLKSYDANTKFAVEDRPNGFALVVEYSQRAFVPKSDDEMSAACIAALTSVAGDEADKRGKKLQPLDPSTVRVSSGRNGLTGHSTCSARGRFFFRD